MIKKMLNNMDEWISEHSDLMQEINELSNSSLFFMIAMILMLVVIWSQYYVIIELIKFFRGCGG